MATGTHVGLAAVDYAGKELNLLPYPRLVMVKGAPFRPAPSSYLYLSPAATPSVRRRAHVLCQQFEMLKIRTTIGNGPTLLANQAYFTTSATFQKSEQMERPLRGESVAPELATV